MNRSGKGSQASFLFEIKGAPKIEIAYFQAQERISEPFVVHVALASTSQIQYDDVIQKEALLTVSGAEADRYFHGIVRKFEHTGKSGQKFLYQADIVPVADAAFPGAGLPHLPGQQRPGPEDPGHRGQDFPGEPASRPTATSSA